MRLSDLHPPFNSSGVPSIANKTNQRDKIKRTKYYFIIHQTCYLPVGGLITF